MKALIAFVIIFFVFVGQSYGGPFRDLIRRQPSSACANGQCAVPQVAVTPVAPAVAAAPATSAVAQTASACASGSCATKQQRRHLLRHRRKGEEPGRTRS